MAEGASCVLDGSSVCGQLECMKHSMLSCSNHTHRGEPGPPCCSWSTCLCSSHLQWQKKKDRNNIHPRGAGRISLEPVNATIIRKWEDSRQLDKVDWPIWGMQGSGLQLSLAAGFSRSSQPSLDCTSWSERQRTSLTRKPPSHVFEHWRDMNQEQQSASHLQKSGLSLISFWHLSKLILVDFTVVCEKYDKISFPNHA